MKKIISEIKKSILPSKSLQKSKTEIADLAFKLVEDEIKKYSEVINLEFGGSFAKGTWLAKNADVDIFIKFKNNTSEIKFEEISKKIGFASMKK
ncbi:MAG: nucleotidyltransferase domain-containing protein, partial [Nitrosopumilus sp.]